MLKGERAQARRFLRGFSGRQRGWVERRRAAGQDAEEAWKGKRGESGEEGSHFIRRFFELKTLGSGENPGRKRRKQAMSFLGLRNERL
jgi:hypothetical protein